MWTVIIRSGLANKDHTAGLKLARKSNENFKVFSGEVQSGLYRVFLGYRLADGGITL